MADGAENPGKGRRRLGWVVWPVVLLWRTASFIERRIGIAGTLAVGLAFLILGFLFNMTLAGMLIGIPVSLLGAMLLLRALY